MTKQIIYKNVIVTYYSFGKGKVTLFLHGYGLDSSSLFFLKEYISGKKIFVDFPPFGKSGKLTSPFDIWDYSNIVDIILDKEQVTDFDIVCHSFGCRIAIILCCTRNVKKLVITGGAGIKNKNIIIKLKKYWYKFLVFLSKMNLISSEKLNNKGSSEYRSLDSIMKKTFSNIVEKDLTYMLKYIKANTLLIWGENDTSTPLKDLKVFEKKIKHNKKYIFKDCNHFALFQNPLKFGNIIRNFLE